MSDLDSEVLIGCLVGVVGAVVLLLFLATLKDRHRHGKSEWSFRELAAVVVSLIIVGGVSYMLELGRVGGVLLLLLSVLVIARLGGLRYGIVATGVAALVLDFLFLPPIGSLSVVGTDNRLALAMFLLSALAGSRLIGAR